MPAIRWIGKALALALHDRQVAEHGGSAGVRDDGLLESALAKPQQLDAYGDPAPDLADLAAALGAGIARNHPFNDGNKRTAAVCCETFLNMNGAELEAADAELFVRYLALAEGKLPEREFAGWIRTHLRLAAPGATRQPRTAYRIRRRRAKPRAKGNGRDRLRPVSRAAARRA